MAQMRSAKPETAPYRVAFAPTDSLAEKRREAFARFEELGFPTRRDEAWRFSNLRPLQEFSPRPRREREGSAPPEVEAAIVPYFFAGASRRLCRRSAGSRKA